MNQERDHHWGDIARSDWGSAVVVALVLCIATLMAAIAIVALATAAFAPAHALLATNGINLSNGTSLFGIATGAALNGQIIGIELPAGTDEPSNR